MPRYGAWYNGYVYDGPLDRWLIKQEIPDTTSSTARGTQLRAKYNLFFPDLNAEEVKKMSYIRINVENSSLDITSKNPTVQQILDAQNQLDVAQTTLTAALGFAKSEEEEDGWEYCDE